MNITFEKERLIEQLAIVGRTVPNRTTLPILECVLLLAEEGGIRLTANDLEMCVETSRVPAEIDEEGSVALNAKLFADIIRKMPGDRIQIKTNQQNQTECRSGRACINISGFPSDEFPVIPQTETTEGFTLKARVLKDMIRQTIFSVAADETKPVLTGEFVQYKDGRLTMVAVDGFRISYRQEPLESEAKQAGAIIPAKALNELSRILPSEADEEVTFHLHEKRVVFVSNTFTFISRLIEGDYIRYDQIFSEDFSTIMTVERIPFLTGVERACLIARENNKSPVKLEIGEEAVVITSVTELGRTYDEIVCEIDGSALSISFNPRYLIDALRAIEDERVVMRFTAPLSPCIIQGRASKPDGALNEAYKYLILPLRVLN